MVLGLKSKSRKDHGVYVDYQISVKELSPWPASLIPTQCVLLKWGNGDHSSGSFITVVGKDSIMFNESFRLMVTLDRDASKKSSEKFLKNTLEFNVYDARKDKAAKHKLLGSAIINLADYGVVKDNLMISAPFTFKKSSRNELNSVLYVDIQALEDDGNDSYSSSPKASLGRSSVDKDGSEFGGSFASYTDDDDVSSHSSRRASTSTESEIKASPGHGGKDPIPEANKDEKKGWKHIKLKHSTNEAVLVSEIERLLREEEKKRQSNAVHISNEGTWNNREGETQKALKDDKNNETGLSDLKNHPFETKSFSMLPPDAAKKQMKLRTNTLALGRKAFGMDGGVSQKLKHMKSIQLHFDTGETKKVSNGVFNNKGTTGPSQQGTTGPAQASRIEMLEEELREAAVLEAGVYSVVPEHTSSRSKVHAPARRLSRFYLHACKASSNSKSASAARATISGLVLVSKACGGDVPRLTFWLSNSVVLRAIVSQGVGKLNLSAGTGMAVKKFQEKDNSNSSAENSDEWEDPRTFIAALEKFEAWIFSRIVKSVWWQTLAPHMQLATTKGLNSKKNLGKRKGSAPRNQGLHSIELWKKALKAASERLCPIRAGHHECGCLPVLGKLVMEQLVSRLDVAMFNAILRESADEMPTDPVSDPISDINVLPIPSSKASFGAGAQLKNAIGTWSRWLADQFDKGEDNPTANRDGRVSNGKIMELGSFKSFHLLNALGDLMMLPFEMLADRSIRKEFCPMLGTSIVKRVLHNFVPDEFNPRRIPKRLFDVLNSEDPKEEADKGFITSFPCIALPTFYAAPPTASVKSLIGEMDKPSLSRTGSSVFQKSHTSDDELDDLNTTLGSIFSAAPLGNSAPDWMPSVDSGRKVVRYQLLKDAWKEGEL